MFGLAARDLLHSPIRTLFTFMALLTFTVVTGVAVFLGEALSASVDEALLEQPAIVIKRQDNAPIDIEDTVRRIKTVPGVLAAWPRILEGNRLPKKGTAEDIAVHVFHPDEALAMLTELRDALPWPAAIITRNDRGAIVKARIAHKTGLLMLLLTPALFSLVYLVFATAQSGAADRREIGIQKSVGWSSQDIIRLHVYRATILGVLPTVTGGLIAAALTASSATPPALRLLLTGPDSANLVLNWTATSALKTIPALMTAVLMPYFIAALIPAIKAVLTDPSELIQ